MDDGHAIVEGLEVLVVGVEHVADDEAGGGAGAVPEEVEADVDEGPADVEADEAGGGNAGGGELAEGLADAAAEVEEEVRGAARGEAREDGLVARVGGGVEVEEAPAADAGVAGCLPGLVALGVG